MKFELWMIITFIIASVISGILSLIYLKKYESTFKIKWLYILLRAAIYSLLVTPTIFGLGHGALPTNGVSGIVIAILGPGENYKFSMSLMAFGRHNGGTVILMPCFIVFLVNYAVNFFKYKFA